MREWLHTILPAWAKDAPFLLENWQWVGLAGLLALGIVVDLVARALVAILARTIARKLDLDAEGLVGVHRCGRPVGMLLGAGTMLLLLQDLELTGRSLLIAEGAGRGLFALAATWLGFRIVDILGDIAAERAARTERQLDDLLVPLVRKSLKALVVIFGAIYFAISVDIQVTPLLAGLGVSSLAIGFAAKSTVENLFGSLTVILDGPFQIGDWVVIGTVEGTVESVGLRSTRIRTFYDSQVVIPNSALLSDNVDNFGRRRARRLRAILCVKHETPAEQLEAFVTALRDLFAAQPGALKDHSHIVLNGFAQGSITVLIYVFFETSDWAREMEARHRFILEIKQLADRMGIAFAFPSTAPSLASNGVSSDGGGPETDDPRPRGGKSAPRSA